MNGDFIRYKSLIAVAVGASVMIGAAGIFLYNQYICKRRFHLLTQELIKLRLSIEDIKGEYKVFKSTVERDNTYMENRSIRQDSGAPSVTTDAETEMFSTMGGDDFYDEFYEISSENGVVIEEDKPYFPYSEVDILLEKSSKEDKTKCYGLLLELLEKEGENDEVLWRLSKACHMMSSIYGAEGNSEKKNEFIFKGVEYGQKAIDLNPSNWKAHKWFAVCIGERGQLQSVKDKLNDGHTFKEHIDKALAINPEDSVLHHLLGRFNYEVASLSWLERRVANTIFGDVPKGTYKDAIKSLLEAEKLNSTAWKDNKLLMAKCHAALKNYQETLKWLDSAKEIATTSVEDKVTEQEIDQLLKKFNPYRKA